MSEKLTFLEAKSKGFACLRQQKKNLKKGILTSKLDQNICFVRIKRLDAY